MAVIYVYYVNTIVSAFGSRQLDWDGLAQVHCMKEWNESMSQLAITQSIEADRQSNMAEFMQKVKAQIQAANAK
jgi:glutathione S-transferase